MGANQETIDELARQIRYHRDAYYNRLPEISDEEFDALEDRLRALAPDHPVLAEVGAPPPAVTAGGAEQLEALELPSAPAELARELQAMAGSYFEAPLDAQDPAAERRYRADVRRYRALWEALESREPGHPVLGQVPPAETKDWAKARHELAMGSLNKVNSPQELVEWAGRCDELARIAGLAPVSGELALTEKLDGLSLELLYDGGRLEAAITRGDGEIGELITANVRHMQGVPARITRQERLSFRGEILLFKADAERMAEWKRGVDARFAEIKSLRNMAAGLARAKDLRYLFGARFLSVLCYDVEGAEGLETEEDKLALIRGSGLRMPSELHGDLPAIIRHFEAYQKGRRAELPYEIDGLVVRASRLRSYALLGELNNRPRAAVAFKFPSEMQVTTLLAVAWSTGDTGRITPVAQIEPVMLAGAKVQQASLHNLANVRRLGIGVGDQVLVSRRNDVIPYVERVVVKGSAHEEGPAICGRCQAPVAVEGEYLVCKNEDCPARRVGRLKTWIRELNLLDFGEKTLERLYDSGLVREPADLYRLTVPKVAALDRLGEKTAEKLLAALAEKRRMPLATFIAALGVETVSRETAKLLVAQGYDSVAKIARAPKEELAAIEGLGEIKAERILRGMQARLAEVERLLAAGVEPVALAQGGPLAGLSFCFSGAHSRPRKELEGLVERHGGAVANNVTKGLSYLVLADASSTSSKAEKARKLGTVVLDEAGFERLVAERTGSQAPVT